jgi:hypothetical protein
MVAFSLTPTLSRWEREKRSQLFVEAMSLFNSGKENSFSLFAYKF